MSTQLAALSHFASGWADLFQRWWSSRVSPGRPVKADAAGDVSGDAASVRALADRWRRTDPGFARDLYAAADRHELAEEAAAGR